MIQKVNVKLRVASLTGKTISESETTWRDRCLMAKVTMADLQKDNKILQEIAAEHSQLLEAQDLTNLTDLTKKRKPLSPRLHWGPCPSLLSACVCVCGGGGLTTQASPQFGGWNEWTEHATSITHSFNGARHIGALRWSCQGTGRLHHVSFSSGWIRNEPCSLTRPIPGGVQHVSGATPIDW